jgi:hypothetical protein
VSDSPVQDALSEHGLSGSVGAYLVVTETPAPESTTLVEEQQNPPQVPNKRVTFLEPRPEFSDILSGPSMYKKPIGE